jgi:hypothetical protein
MQRHLATFKTHFMKTARTRFLTLVSASRGFAKARSDAATYAALRMLSAFCRLNGIKLHHVLRSSAMLKTPL